MAELRKRQEISPAFNLLKFHTTAPKISYLSYPDFDRDPHPALVESIIVDLITGKTRRDDYRVHQNRITENRPSITTGVYGVA